MKKSIILIGLITFLLISCKKKEEKEEIKLYPPTTDFLASLTKTSIGVAVQFTDQSTNNPNHWVWEFGDGSSSLEQNPIHSYNKIGVYTVKLTAKNKNGENAKIKQNYITIESGSGGAPVIEFFADNTTPLVNTVVNFHDQSTISKKIIIL
jgi:PKD repeat protein